MSEEQEDLEAPKGEKVYLGNTVPKLLRWVYAAFIGWAVFYVVKYLVPDLSTWLK